MERVKGIEPSSQAWEAHVLPLNHTRTKHVNVYHRLHGDTRRDFAGPASAIGSIGASADGVANHPRLADLAGWFSRGVDDFIRAAAR